MNSDTAGHMDIYSNASNLFIATDGNDAKYEAKARDIGKY